MPDAIEVRKVPLHTVSDASELGKLIDDGIMEADRVIAVIGKTEGNGGVNDYTRIIADRAFREILIEKGADPAKVKEIPIVWSGGTDGVIRTPPSSRRCRRRRSSRRRSRGSPWVSRCPITCCPRRSATGR